MSLPEPETRCSLAERNVAPVVVMAGVTKVYRTGRVDQQTLAGIDLVVPTGEIVAVIGPSGSGKSTLLNLVTGIDRPTTGTVAVAGARVDMMNEEELAAWRGRTIGIVFQFFQLLPTLSAVENATLPLDFARIGARRDRRAVALANLELVGLADKADRLPVELSGGEQQRVAIARALANDPPLIVGDEPTGNLDSDTAARMFDVLEEVNDRGKSVLFVTHDATLAARAHRRVTIRDGRVVSGSGL